MRVPNMFGYRVSRRSQAAMEFMMTYGWAIIVVILAVGALAYMGLPEPDAVIPQRAFFTTPLSGADLPTIYSNGSVYVTLTNNAGYRINISTQAGSYNGTNSCGNIAGLSAPTGVIQNGENFNIIFDCGALTVDEKFDSDLSFTYTNTFSGQEHVQKGNVVGKIVGP